MGKSKKKVMERGKEEEEGRRVLVIMGVGGLVLVVGMVVGYWLLG